MLSPGVPGIPGDQGGHMALPLVPCVYFRGGAVYFKGSVAQKVVLLISILEHAASLVRVACACNSPGVRGWGVLPRPPGACGAVWRLAAPMCGKALNFFSSAENYFASFKILAGMCGVRVCGASAPIMRPKVSSACCYAKEGRVTFQTLTTQNYSFPIPI